MKDAMTSRYDHYQIHPVVALDKDGQPTQDESKIVGYDQCAEDDPDLFMWSVYGHLPQGGIECIADCVNTDAAELIYAGLMERQAKPALLDAALLARDALQPRPPAKSLTETVGNAVMVERAIRAIDRAVTGATISESYILVPVEKATVRRLLPDVDEDRLGEVMENFRERLQDGLLEEHLPDLARDVCGAGMRA